MRGVAAIFVLAVTLASPALALPALSGADATLVHDTADWHLEAPDSLGSQADLELNGRQIQLCSDEIERLIHHRPQPGTRFTWRWILGGGPVSGATQTGVMTWFPDARWRLVDPATRSFRESVVAQGLCYGPHEITHVLTWDSLAGTGWGNEGFATFTDWLYESAAWRYGQPLQLRHDCDETGWTFGAEHHPYSDLTRFGGGYEMYATGACFWREVHRRGGFPAIRRILMRMRAYPGRTPAEIIVHHVNTVLGTDFRPIAKRFGFTDADLVIDRAAPPDPAPPALTVSRPKLSSAPRAGRTLTASVAVTRSDTGDAPASATVSCAASVRRAKLPVAMRRLSAGRATCTWRVPRTARGRSLHATIVVSVRGVAAKARVAARVR